MDNYLEEFTEQLETLFNPESLFPAEKPRSGWLMQLFSKVTPSNENEIILELAGSGELGKQS